MDATATISPGSDAGANTGHPTDESNPSFRIVGAESDAPLVILCDHASNLVPPEYGTLGVPAHQLARHIAYDIGCEPLAECLSERLGVTAILTSFTRLLVDPNRGEDDPTLVMRLSDGAIIPGNEAVDADERERRLERYYRPYHNAVERIIDDRLQSGCAPVLLSLHSFTPEWKGVIRPWHAGILWDKDPRFARPLIDHLSADGSLFVGDNEPYTGALRNDTMYRHGTMRGLAHALLEIRNDLIDNQRGVLAWADRLTPILADILADGTLAVVENFGSKSDPQVGRND